MISARYKTVGSNASIPFRVAQSATAFARCASSKVIPCRAAVISVAYAAISSAAELLDSALASLEAELPLDLCCVNIECAMSSLGEVGGRDIGEEIVGEIFSKFCVGK